jgi:hypothetical protein
MVYAAFVGTWMLIEAQLPRTELLVKLESFTSKLNVLPFEKGIVMAPATQPRERPSIDYMDAYTYWKGRYLRQYSQIFESTKATMIILINKPIRYAIGFRLLCFVLPIGEPIRAILAYVGFGNTIAQHLQWFQDSYFFGFEISDTLFKTTIMQSSTMAFAFVFSDFLRNLIGRVFGVATSGLASATGGVFDLLPSLWILAIPPLIVYGIKKYIREFKAKQQADFAAKWSGGLREEIMRTWCTQEDYLYQSPWTAADKPADS